MLEAYAGDAHAVNIQGFMSLAQNLSTIDIINHIKMFDNTIRIISELKNLLKDEDRRRNSKNQLIDCGKAVNKTIATKKRITAQRRDKRFNLYQVEAATTEQAPAPAPNRKKNRSILIINQKLLSYDLA